jgi:hypothetical protein
MRNFLVLGAVSMGLLGGSTAFADSRFDRGRGIEARHELRDRREVRTVRAEEGRGWRAPFAGERFRNERRFERPGLRLEGRREWWKHDFRR